jgi:thymidine kinase
MAKLYFRHGTVGSAKTLNLLAVAHNYRQQGKRVLLLKPEIDTRFGRDVIKTRAGLEAEADALLPASGPFNLPDMAGVVCLLVDEAQFMQPEIVDQLHALAHPHRGMGIPVICYGLRTDFRRQLFPAAARLIELADSIEEIKTTCHYCLRKAVFNLRMRDGSATFDGPVVELGLEDKYLPVCANCYGLKYLAWQRKE